MVNDHYPYEKWLFHWEYTLFSDKPICKTKRLHIADGIQPTTQTGVTSRPVSWKVGMLYIAMKSNALPSVINFANGDPQLEES